MEQLVNLNSTMSLKQIAVVQVACYLWDGEIPLLNDIHSYESIEFCNSETGLANSRENVKNKVCQLVLPELVKTCLVELGKPMGEEIWNFFLELEDAVELLDVVVRRIVWTALGVLDKQKTVQLLLEDNQTLDIETQFGLARIYCLADQVGSLLSELSLEQIKSMRFQFCYYKDKLELFWKQISPLDANNSDEIARVCHQVDSYVDLDVDVVDALLGAASKSNITGTKYFLQKLSSTEREFALVETAVNFAKKAETVVHMDIVCHLLQHMNAAEQAETFQNATKYVLECFLHWPWHVYFIDVANCMWDVLVEYLFYDMLVTLIHFVPRSLPDRRNFFKQFWSQCPEAHKKFVMNDSILFCSILLQLIEVEDMQNMMLVLESANNNETQDPFLSHEEEAIWNELILSHSWNELKALLSKCLYSKETLLEFDAKFESFQVFQYPGVNLATWNRIISELHEMLETNNVAASRRNDQHE